MLLSFKVANYRSIKNEQTISFLASKHRELSDSLGKSQHVRNGILPVLAIFGANAAGKTTLYRALELFSEAVNYSHRTWQAESELPFEPHFFADSQETLMEAEFLFKDAPYRFGFVAGETKFAREWLYQGKKRVYVRNGDDFTFGRVGGLKSITRFTRANALFLSTAAQNNHDLLSGIAKSISQWIALNDQTSAEREFTTDLLKRERAKKFLIKALRTLDPQIIDIERTDVKLKRPFESVDSSFESLFNNAESWAALRVTRSSDDGKKQAQVGIYDESAGTRRYFTMIGPVMAVLTAGALLLIDEADSSLHPTLLKAVVQLFQSRRTNPRGAQLVITTHDTSLLSGGILRPDEVYFVDKDHSEGTQIYSLADFAGTRSGASSQRQYLEGRFGALPFLEDHQSIFAEEIRSETGEEADVPAKAS